MPKFYFKYLTEFALSFFILQLSTTSSSRAAFLQCLRWGIFCPFQSPAQWKGEEIQLVLRGGAKPNPYGVMVYSTETFAKSHASVPLSAAGTAQVTQRIPTGVDFWIFLWIMRQF